MTTPCGTQRRAVTLYNILPIHDLLAEHPSLRFPKVRATATALRAVGGLHPPPFSLWRAD
jgi:callose synthase